MLTCRLLAAPLLLSSLTVAQQQPPRHPLPPKPGIADPQAKFPLAKAIPEAKFDIPGSPDWIAVGDDIWVSNKPGNNVTRIDPRTNTVKQTISGFEKPCSGLAIGFGSLWVPNCGNQTLSRVDLQTGNLTKSISTSIADSEGGLATGAGSVWLLTDKNSTLARLDPDTNAIAATVKLPEGCFNAAFGFDAVWVSCTKRDTVLKIEPATNRVAATIATGPEPRFLTIGEGAVWTLNQGDGSITRISPAKNQVEATIQVGIPGPGGDISAGEGSVWATSFGFPISRIDPATNKVVQQFVGDGGDAIRAGGGAVWLSNYKFGTEWKLNPKKLAKVTNR